MGIIKLAQTIGRAEMSEQYDRLETKSFFRRSRRVQKRLNDD